MLMPTSSFNAGTEPRSVKVPFSADVGQNPMGRVFRAPPESDVTKVLGRGATLLELIDRAPPGIPSHFHFPLTPAVRPARQSVSWRSTAAATPTSGFQRQSDAHAPAVLQQRLLLSATPCPQVLGGINAAWPRFCGATGTPLAAQAAANFWHR